LKALDEIMKRPLERPPGKSFLHRPRLRGEIAFQDIDFSYPDQQTPALNGCSFKILPGERVGILGRIGSGKSTVARLMLGLYEQQRGTILVDGTDLRQIDPADLRRNIGYVSQDNYLFFGSVRDNIAFGAPHLDDEAVIRAAGIAGVSEFLRVHPHGYDLQVGERGMSLSGGQRQAVVVARAFVLDPPIVVLDEPTSHMDNSTEAAMKERLEPVLAGKTVLLITHRSSMLSLVDRLIVLDRGKVVADGPKDEVVQALKGGRIKVAGTYSNVGIRYLRRGRLALHTRRAPRGAAARPAVRLCPEPGHLLLFPGYADLGRSGHPRRGNARRGKGHPVDQDPGHPKP
jgi:ATP-binding cassette subfamily C protein LapB